jgi:CheY-like chemotaxis protein
MVHKLDGTVAGRDVAQLHPKWYDKTGLPNQHSDFQDRPMAARILIVDDEPMVRALIARALTDEGYEVVAVANGQAALDAARGAEVGFDLIITNSYMPGLTGAELVARVRQDFPDLPILHVDDIGRRSRLGSVPEDIPTIYKPFSIASLREAVRRLVPANGF